MVLDKLEVMARMMKKAHDEILKGDHVMLIQCSKNRLEIFVTGEWLIKQDFIRGKRFYYTAADTWRHHIAVDVWGVTFTALLKIDELCQLWEKTREEAEPSSNIITLESVA